MRLGTPSATEALFFLHLLFLMRMLLLVPSVYKTLGTRQCAHVTHVAHYADLVILTAIRRDSGIRNSPRLYHRDDRYHAGTVRRLQ